MIKLKKFFRSKSFYVIISVLLGIMTWLMVLNYTNPTETRTLEIPLNILNKNSPASLGLSDRNSSVPEKITVKASGRADIIGNLAASDLYAAVDFAKITKAGAMTINVKEPECNKLGIKIVDYYPKTIDIMYDKLSNTNVDVIVDYDNTLLAEGFEILSVTAEPSSVQISGFESDVAEIDCIKVKLNESHAVGSIDSSRTSSYIGHYYLKNGEEVTADYEAEKITVKIEVAKRVPIVYSVTGIPHEDYYLNKTGITADTVLLCGSATDLRNISKIELGKIDVSGASSNVIKNFDITAYLPAGITAHQTTDVSVSAEILKYEIKQFNVDISTSISTPGKNPREYTYEFSVQSFDVKVKGKAVDLNNLSISSLGPAIDLTNKGVGEYVLPLEFTNLDTAKYTIIGEYLCSVKITEYIAPTAPPTAEPTPDGGNGSEATSTPSQMPAVA